ncbi:hypothetical protein Cgig2_014175 [Carnegiea gigantea]|uniref:Uncharacterized protein n=1 Tax=Carnegiea gigantea TaxID=171969 RepID=A0A9Q1QE00_9CARY|nr:hypothetical protein Cgig2_014175 [Carnegiea gigantea]
MAFPHSLSTKEMAEYVIHHFAWDRPGVAFPLSPLPKDFQALCLSYELAMAEEAAEDYEIPALSQVIFYAILQNEAERLGVLHRRALRTLKSVLTKLRWNTFKSWVWLYGDCIFEAWFRMRAAPEEGSGAGQQGKGSEEEPKGEGSTTEGAASPSNDEKHWRRALCLPHPLPEDFHTLCPRFSLPEAEGAAADFELSEMVQATFYAMLLNEAVELGVVHSFMAKGLKAALVGLRWSSFEDPMDPGPRPLPSDDHGLCPRFDLAVARRYAHDSHIPEMVPVIFYAMVIDDAAELGLSCRLTMDVVMWAMRKLDWGPVEAWLGDND